MELDKLRYFKRIAELENISKVAKEVNIAQSALSRMLKSLEDEFHAPLFDRRGKNIYLNENGSIHGQGSHHLCLRHSYTGDLP